MVTGSKGRGVSGASRHDCCDKESRGSYGDCDILNAPTGPAT